MLYYLQVIHNHRDIDKQKNCPASERKSACTDYWFVDKCFLFDFQVRRRSLLLLTTTINEESEAASALTVLDVLLIFISLTNVGATVFDDIVPGWAKSETVCQALLTRWADYQTNFTGFTAILGKPSKKRVLRRIRKLLKEEKKSNDGRGNEISLVAGCWNDISIFIIHLKKLSSVIFTIAVATRARLCSNRAG